MIMGQSSPRLNKKSHFRIFGLSLYLTSRLDFAISSSFPRLHRFHSQLSPPYGRLPLDSASFARLDEVKNYSQHDFYSHHAVDLIKGYANAS